MADARSFYGGETPTGGAGGEISTGHYEGYEAQALAPWKCPACGVENSGPLPLGCTSCGRGKPGVHVGVTAPPAKMTVPDERPIVAAAKNGEIAWTGFLSATQHQAFAAWYARQEDDVKDAPRWLVRRVFIAGWQAAQGQTLHAARPVTVELAPEGKVRRTILAALAYFSDQILREQPEEIATGEWCSVEEVTQLIADLQRRDPDD